MAAENRVRAVPRPSRVRALLVPAGRPGVGGPPVEWEQMKARCRNLSPHDAVMECAYLSAQYREMCRSMSLVQPDFRQIILALRTKKIPFVLTGAHGISTWTGRPRSTHDVDILVKAGRNQARAANALKALYPQLEMRTFHGVVAFFVPGEKESVIDVTYPHRADNEVTLQTAVWIKNDGLEYRIPALEAAMANKYGAMLCLSRDIAKRTIDSVNFAHMVRHSTDAGREPIDLERLAALGELVWPGGGGKEILRLVEQVKAGQMPSINPPT